jgi:heme exporter protein D
MGINPEPESPKSSALKNPLLYGAAVIVLVAGYVGWILVSRHIENSQIDERARQEQQQKQRESDEAALEQLGGKDMAIQMFYATPSGIRRGETTQLCYGVANAKSVKLEPQSNPVWSSHNRCVDVQPKKTTTYTLTIDDGAGHTQSQQVIVTVR